MQTSGFEIFDMLARAQLTGQAIYIAAKLRIADYLKDGAKSVEELAVRTETHPDSLYRLLRMLASIGIFAEIKEEDDKQEQANQKIRRRFELTPMAFLLQSYITLTRSTNTFWVDLYFVCPLCIRQALGNIHQVLP
ncbi:MAG: hypothetical protein ACJ708_12700 [Nitrososphaeraceae archaeon]